MGVYKASARPRLRPRSRTRMDTRTHLLARTGADHWRRTHLHARTGADHWRRVHRREYVCVCVCVQVQTIGDAYIAVTGMVPPPCNGEDSEEARPRM